ncbi:hypothetical protein DSO57_1006992 [Entomophthora muscae]|uniref:Uncharacterized protein n=1 Tax=Entomophthora muscae TaxID=34485 RepID=A0ACC2UHF9_9FUNG|nr:hypothetical protein DSO57_1006992 [Entomophthora muscae]
MVPTTGFASKSKNPGAGKSPPPASPAWWLGAGSIPAWGFETVTFMPPKSITKSTPKASKTSKDNTNPPKAKKVNTTPRSSL